MESKELVQPFFSKFMEGQSNTKGEQIDWTLPVKDLFQTMKYPSDGDELPPWDEA